MKNIIFVFTIILTLLYPMEGRVSGMLVTVDSLVKEAEYICLVESIDNTKTIKEGDLELMEVKVLEIVKSPPKSFISNKESIKIVIGNSFLSLAQAQGISISVRMYESPINPRKSKRFIVYLGGSNNFVKLKSPPKHWDTVIPGAFDHENMFQKIKELINKK